MIINGLGFTQNPIYLSPTFFEVKDVCALWIGQTGSKEKQLESRKRYGMSDRLLIPELFAVKRSLAKGVNRVDTIIADMPSNAPLSRLISLVKSSNGKARARHAHMNCFLIQMNQSVF
ncbi:MAG: hypothetical protein ACJASL_004727 [Paraglaciecola sp.]|jgi:hypothetical protein